MKKILLTMAFVLTALGNAWADDVTVGGITIPERSSATLKINLVNDGTVEYRQLFQMDLELPKTIEVLSYQLDPTRIDNVEETAASLKMNEQTSSDSDTRVYRFVCKSDDTDPIVGESGGAILTIQLLATSTLKKDDVLSGKLTGIEVTDQSSTAFRPANKTFNITIGEPLPLVTLNETSTTAPETTSEAVDVIVNRTINSSDWSTICLPFGMSAAQVKEAFGDDVKLADLAGWSFTGSATSADNINLVFSPVTAIEKNHPYMIKVSSKVTQFSVGNVIIDPDDEPTNTVTYTVGSGRNKKEYDCNMYGNYVYGGVYGGDFFLSGNKLWFNENDEDNYIKAFRCTFNFAVTLSEGAASRIAMSFEEKATDINDINVAEDDSSDEYYNLQGQRVDTPAKGVFIKGGKKILVK